MTLSKYARYGQQGTFTTTSASTQTKTQTKTKSGKSIATLRYLPNGVLLQLECPFNRAFVETLKATIPFRKRTFEGKDKTWFIVRDQFDTLTHILQMYYDDVLLLDFPAAQVGSNAYSELHLTSDAPIQVVQAVYRVLAKLYHPDHGGSDEKMSKINVAYKEIMGELINGEEKK